MASVMSSPNQSRVAVSATKLLINNRWISSESGKTFGTVNPATGEEICQVAEADAADDCYTSWTPGLRSAGSNSPGLDVSLASMGCNSTPKSRRSSSSSEQVINVSRTLDETGVTPSPSCCRKMGCLLPRRAIATHPGAQNGQADQVWCARFFQAVWR